MAAVAASVALVLAGCGGAAKAPTRSAPRTPHASAPPTDLASVAARADDVPVLCYHQIRPPTASDAAADKPYIVAPAALSKQMQALDEAGFHTLTADELVAHVARGARLPSKPVLLTFDDASAGQFTSALPILRRHRFVATFFVMTVVLDKPGWLTRRQVRSLDRAGMSIGAHTWDHHAVPDYRGEDWQNQIDEPTRELAKLVGHPMRVFAYPFGLWNAAAIPHLWHAGFTAAFQLGERLDRHHPLWNLRRIIVPGWTGRELLRQIDRSF